jgi:uncharacterized membrane protein (DUF106 family)
MLALIATVAIVAGAIFFFPITVMALVVLAGIFSQVNQTLGPTFLSAQDPLGLLILGIAVITAIYFDRKLRVWKKLRQLAR